MRHLLSLCIHSKLSEQLYFLISRSIMPKVWRGQLNPEGLSLTFQKLLGGINSSKSSAKFGFAHSREGFTPHLSGLGVSQKTPVLPLRVLEAAENCRRSEFQRGVVFVNDHCTKEYIRLWLNCLGFDDFVLIQLPIKIDMSVTWESVFS